MPGFNPAIIFTDGYNGQSFSSLGANVQVDFGAYRLFLCVGNQSRIRQRVQMRQCIEGHQRMAPPG